MFQEKGSSCHSIFDQVTGSVVDIANIQRITRERELLFAQDSAFSKAVEQINRVTGGFSPPVPTTPGMRVRTGRFTQPIGP